jgi:hypothetical protein
MRARLDRDRADARFPTDRRRPGADRCRPGGARLDTPGYDSDTFWLKSSISNPTVVK